MARYLGETAFVDSDNSLLTALVRVEDHAWPRRVTRLRLTATPSWVNAARTRRTP